MNFLHRFLLQPCFDNAGSGRGGGGRGGVKTGGADRRDSEPNGIGLSNNVGRGDSGGRSGGRGGDRGVVTTRVRTVAPPPTPTVAPPPAPVRSVPSIAQLTAHNMARPAAPTVGVSYGPAAIGSAPIGGVSGVNTIGGLNGGSMAALGMDRAPTGSVSSGGISGVNSIGGMNGGSMAALGMDRAPVGSVSRGGISGVNSIGGMNGGSMASLGMDRTGGSSTRSMDPSPSSTHSKNSSLPSRSRGAFDPGFDDGDLTSTPSAYGRGTTPQNPSGITGFAGMSQNPQVQDYARAIGSLRSQQQAQQTTPQAADPLANSRAVQSSLGAIRDHLNFGYDPNVTKAQAPDTRAGYDFYSSDNSYQGVNFPSVNEAYPTGGLPPVSGGYSSTPEGAWTQGAQSFASPMEAARNMGIMDQMRAANMFTRGGTAPARNDGTNRGGGETRRQEVTPARQSVAQSQSNAATPAGPRSGWRPYTGASRFENWSPLNAPAQQSANRSIMSAILGDNADYSFGSPMWQNQSNAAKFFGPLMFSLIDAFGGAVSGNKPSQGQTPTSGNSQPPKFANWTPMSQGQRFQNWRPLGAPAPAKPATPSNPVAEALKKPRPVPINIRRRQQGDSR